MLKLASKEKPDLIDLDLIDEDLRFLKGIFPEGGPAIQPEELEPELYPEPEEPEDTTLSEMEAEVKTKLAEELAPAPVKYPDIAMYQPHLWLKKREPEEIKTESVPSAIRAAPEKTPIQKILEQITPFKATKVEQIARAQNVVAIAKQLDQPVRVVQENYPEAMDAVMKKRGPTAVDLMALGVAPFIAVGLSANAARTLLGLAKFAGAFEVINLSVSMIKDEDYQFLAGKGVSDLLPEESSQLARETADIAEFIAVGLAAVGASKAAPKLVERVTMDIFTEFKAPKRIVIPARKVASIFRTGEEISPEEVDIIKSLGLSGSEYRTAVKQGLDIRIPAEKITTLVPKPYWVKLRSIFGRPPAEKITRVDKAGERTIDRAPAGELPAETPKPEVKIEVKAIPPEKPPGAAEGKKLEKKVEALPEPKAPKEPTPEPAKRAEEEAVPEGELTAWKRAATRKHVEEQESYEKVLEIWPETEDTPVARFAREVGREFFGKKKAVPKKEKEPVLVSPLEHPPTTVPIKDIKVSPEDFQFKRDVDERGIQEGTELEGEYSEFAATSILVWQAKDGTMFVVNGHHRLAKAQDEGQTHISVQIVKETEGYTKVKARALGAITNIQQGRGSPYDWVEFFKETEISEAQSRKYGLEGKAFRFAEVAGDNLLSSFKNRIITSKEAFAIAEVAGKDESVQAIGMRLVQTAKEKGQKLDPADLTNQIKATIWMKANTAEAKTVQDLFGDTHDAALETSAKLAKFVAKRQKELRETINALRVVQKENRLDKLKEVGLVEKYASVTEALEALKKAEAELEKWKHWETDRDLRQVILEEMKAAEEPKLDLGKEEGIEGAPSGLADTGGYADIGGYEAPPGAEPGPSAMDLPEIVELARQLMQGKMPRIIRKLRAMHGLAVGIFRPFGKGAIELKASLFKDPLEGAKVLAHEIGHLIDWLPEKTMARGNILGRIASLRKYMKHYLENRPGSAGPLTDADRARLRKEARKLVKEKSGELIDEEIRKEMPITPEDVLAIWRDATTGITKEKNPELYEYIARLSNAEKASIVKEAMKGIVPRRLRQFAKAVMEKTGRKIKTEPSEKDIYDKYRELILKEIEKRKLFQLDTIMNELIDLTHAWKPFDPLVSPNYTKYRYSSTELYADALSVLITNPAFLREKAPHFYEGFFNYLERKPEVKSLYEQIQNEIKSGANQRSLVMRTRDGFLKREEEYQRALAKRRGGLTDKDGWGTWFLDKNFAITRRVNKIGESNIPDNFNPAYKLEEWRHSGTEAEGYLVDLNADVLEPLKKAGLTHIDLGEYLFHWRVSTERAELANPLGWTAERSKQRIKEMDETFGPILNEMKDAYRKLRKDWFISKAREAKIYSPDQLKTIVENENYATFDIVGHLEKNYGREATSHIFRQIGTFTETGNPLTATVLKDLLMMRSINKQLAAESVVRFFQAYLPKEIKPAETRWNGRFQEVLESGDPDFKLVVFLKNGELKGYYLPRYVAEAFRKNPVESMIISKLLRSMAAPFRALFTQFSPPFWTINLPRDYKSAAKQLPKLTMTKFLSYYLKAVAPAFRSTFGKPDEIVKRALKNKSLISIASYHHDVTEDLELERLLKRYSVVKSVWNMRVLKPFSLFIDGMSKTAQAMERIPKLGGLMYLEEKFPEMSKERMAHLVRARAGSPDFLRTGTGAPIYNNLLLFSNAMKEGLRSSFESASESFGEYLWKTIKYNLLWKTFVYAASLGLLGFGLKRIFDGVSEYDKSNYNIYPIGLTETGKSVYWRVPQDETGRIIGALYWLALNKGQAKDFASIFDYMAGQVPGLNPAFEVMWSVTDYIGGRNPYDHFRGRPIINEDVFLAGGKRSHKAFAKWISNEFGGSIIHRFKHDGIKEIQTELERYLNMPVVGSIASRHFKVSDYGIREKINKEMRQVASMAAEDRLLMNEAIVKLLEAKGESLTNEEILAVARNIDSIPYYTTKALSYKYGNVFMQKLITARSNEQKAVILRQMIAYMPYARKIGPAQYLDSMVEEIKERASNF